MRFAESVKRLRKQRGWTQARLAMEAHVSQQAISFLERERNEPSVDMVRALSAAFGVPSSVLMGENQVEYDYHDAYEHRLIDILSQLNDAGKTFLLQQAESILQQPAFRQETSISSAV